MVGQAEGEGKLPCGTHKSGASLVGSCLIIQSQHLGCPREAAPWGEVAVTEADPEGPESWRCLLALSSAVSILPSQKGHLGGESSCLLL